MGEVLEIAPNPCWVSGQVSKPIIVIIKTYKYLILKYDHGY
jgi:hypothetical protein